MILSPKIVINPPRPMRSYVLYRRTILVQQLARSFGTDRLRYCYFYVMMIDKFKGFLNFIWSLKKKWSQTQPHRHTHKRIHTHTHTHTNTQFEDLLRQMTGWIFVILSKATERCANFTAKKNLFIQERITMYPVTFQPVKMNQYEGKL